MAEPDLNPSQLKRYENDKDFVKCNPKPSTNNTANPASHQSRDQSSTYNSRAPITPANPAPNQTRAHSSNTRPPSATQTWLSPVDATPFTTNPLYANSSVAPSPSPQTIEPYTPPYVPSWSRDEWSAWNPDGWTDGWKSDQAWNADQGWPQHQHNESRQDHQENDLSYFRHCL